MKIAVATDDRARVRQGHFCGSRYFVVIEILNAEVTDRSVRANSAAEGREPVEGGREWDVVLRLLKDCSLFMGGDFDTGFLDAIAAQGIDCITTDLEGIDDAVCSYLGGKLARFSYYNPDMKEHLPCTDRPYS
jgi:predicted Fe-Mo cluster-binding NifX family protein